MSRMLDNRLSGGNLKMELILLLKSPCTERDPAMKQFDHVKKWMTRHCDEMTMTTQVSN